MSRARRLPPDGVFEAVVGQQWGGAWRLLKRVAYWQRYARVQWDGKLWVAKTREEWAEEVGVPLRRIRLWLQVLGEEGLIETSQHFFGRRCIGHVRLTRRAQKLLWGHGKVATRGATKGYARAATKVATRGATKVATPTNGDTAIRDDNRDSQLPGDREGERSERDQGAGVRGGRKSVAEVRETLRQKHEHETSDEHLEELMEEAAESGSMKALERVWRCCWLRSQGAFYRAWSRTEQHQARELIDQLEDPDLAVELIRAAVEQWSACTTAVKRDAALREAPARPAVGWLLRYRTDVWAWFASREEAGGARRGTTVAEAIESGEL